MPEIIGNGLPISDNNLGQQPGGLFEPVDARFERSFIDKPYTLREILTKDNCEVLLPTKDKFHKYIKSKIAPEKSSVNIIQSLIYILFGLAYLPSIISGFYNSSFLAANTNITGETHHSILIHNYAIVWGDYTIPFFVTAGLAGIFQLFISISKLNSDNKEIEGILESYDNERKNTIKEHSLIASFITLCEILHQIKKALPLEENSSVHQLIKKDIASTCEKYNIWHVNLTHSVLKEIKDLSLKDLDTNIRRYLLSDIYSEITKTIICKISENISEREIDSVFNNHRREINPNFKRDLSQSFTIQNRILDIIANLCVEKIDVRENPIPTPVRFTRDLDLLGVREPLNKYWGDLPKDELKIHYTIDFYFLSNEILINYSKCFPEHFYKQETSSIKRPLLRQAPALVYHPEPLLHSCLQPPPISDIFHP